MPAFGNPFLIVIAAYAALLVAPSNAIAITLTEEDKVLLTEYERYREQISKLERSKRWKEFFKDVREEHIFAGSKQDLLAMIGNPQNDEDAQIKKLLQELNGFMDKNGEKVKAILSQGEVHGGKVFDELKAARKNAYWDKEGKLLLLTPEQLKTLPPGTVVHSISDEKATAGFRSLDTDTRGGYTAWGVKQASPEALSHVQSLPTTAGAGVLKPTSNFADFLKTDPESGQPIILRNGKWVTTDQRLEELMRLVQKVVPAVRNAGPGHPQLETLAGEINKADIPDGVFTGSKYYRKIADPKLAKVLEMEWYLGQGSKMLKDRSAEFAINSWLNCGYGWFMENIKGDKVIEDTLKKVGRVASEGGSLVKKGVVPGIAALAGTSLLLFTSSKAESANTVGSDNVGPARIQYDDSSFGAAAIRD